MIFLDAVPSHWSKGRHYIYKKNYKVAVQLSINFSENWNFWN